MTTPRRGCGAEVFNGNYFLYTFLAPPSHISHRAPDSDQLHLVTFCSVGPQAVSGAKVGCV